MTAPYTQAQWQQILANAHKKLVSDPTNPRWRQAMHDAVNAIGTQSPEPVTQEATGPIASTALGFGEGASSGLASRAGDLLPGPSNTEALTQARAAHPFLTGAGDVAGMTAQAILASRLPGIRALGPTGQGITTGGLTGAARGGVEGGPIGALIGGGLGGLGGYVGGKIAARVIPAGKAVGEDLRSLFVKPTTKAATEDADAALRTTLSKVFKPQDLDAAVAAAKKGQLRQMIPQAPPDPLNVATAIRRGTLEPSTAGTRGYRPAGPKTSKPGKPIWYGSGSPTKSAAVRGGERLLPDPRPGVLLRQTPFQTLQATLREPSTPQMVKDAILQEIQRRGIVGEGLLPPLQR